ncbi:MAG: polymer-forming cytoskeletal protein [Alphaproteobacteria bacterium]
MFHRVKSEPEIQPGQLQNAARSEPVVSVSTASTPVVAPKTQDNTQATVQKQAPVTATPGGYTVPSSSSQSHDTPKQEKDTSMSDNTDNATSATNTPNTARDDNGQAKAVDIPSSAYGTQPAAASRGYAAGGAAYTGYGASAAAAAAASTSSTPAASAAASYDERRLVIGQGITMSGEIEHCDVLLVEGTIEAALKGAKMLEISESGTFYGTVEIDEANISGRFEGDLTVNGRLRVHSCGVITGSISYKELQIEAGAVIDGKLTPLKEGGAGVSQKPSVRVKDKSKEAAAASVKTKEVKENASNDEGELFSARAAAE